MKNFNYYIQLKKQIAMLEIEIKSIEPLAQEEALKIFLNREKNNNNIIIDNDQIQCYIQFKKICNYDEELESMKKELKKLQAPIIKTNKVKIDELKSEIELLQNNNYTFQLKELISELKAELTVTKPLIVLKIK